MLVASRKLSLHNVLVAKEFGSQPSGLLRQVVHEATKPGIGKGWEDVGQWDRG